MKNIAILIFSLLMTSNAISSDASNLVNTKEIVNIAKKLLLKNKSLDASDLAPGLIKILTNSDDNNEILQIEIDFYLASSQRPLEKELKDKLYIKGDEDRYKEINTLKTYTVQFNAYHQKETLLITEGDSIVYVPR